MAAPAPFQVEAAHGLHRGLRIVAATYWPAARVKAAIQAGLVAQPVPCAAHGHHLALRRSGKGWVVAVKCQDEQGRVIHPPTRGALRAVV